MRCLSIAGILLGLVLADPATPAAPAGVAFDCNGNGVPDACDLAAGTSLDLDADGVPDECQVP